MVSHRVEESQQCATSSVDPHRRDCKSSWQLPGVPTNWHSRPKAAARVRQLSGRQSRRSRLWASPKSSKPSSYGTTAQFCTHDRQRISSTTICDFLELLPESRVVATETSVHAACDALARAGHIAEANNRAVQRYLAIVRNAFNQFTAGACRPVHA